MRVSYQHANVHSGNESTLLRFTTADGTRACVLVDAGAGVDLDALLDDGEYLNAIVLTHGHIDHYRTLGENVRHSAPVYTSPATATVLEHALPEASKDNDLGDVDAGLSALEPIDGWTSILPTLEVRPVPAGHVPGGTGFVFRFRDEVTTDDPLFDSQHMLVTGDFTTRPCGGFSPLETLYPFDIDCLLLNVATDDSYVATLNESLQTVFERAYAGSRVVVATSSLTGVHYATVLGHCSATLDRPLPITLVGQAAKLYDALEYDVAHVDTQPVFERAETVLQEGGVTIGGPDTPTTGSSHRLLQAIDDDPGAVFVQLGPDSLSNRLQPRCTTHSFGLSNHPTLETIDDVVRTLTPQELIIKHASGGTLNRFQRRFDRCFTWGTNDSDVYRLYENGEWHAPDWIAESTARRIRQRRWDAVCNQSIGAGTLRSVGRNQHVDLEAEGVDLDALEAAFSRSTLVAGSTDSSCPEVGLSESNTEPEASLSDSNTESEASLSGSNTETHSRDTSQTDTAVASSEGVRARVLTDGDEQFLRLLEDADVSVGDIVELTVETSREDDPTR